MKIQYLKQGLPSDWNEVGKIYAALGDSYRQRILLAFEPGETISIKQIVDPLDLSRTAVVHHLNVLRDAGILHCEKSGREMLYWIDMPRIQWALESLRTYISALKQKQ